MFLTNLTAEEALAEIKKEFPDVITPSLKVLDDAAHGKVYSGRGPDGRLWKIIRKDDDVYETEILEN